VASIIADTWPDLSQARLAAPEVTLTTVSPRGTRVMVPPGIRAEAPGFSVVGGIRAERSPEPGPGAPAVYVRAFSLAGGVRIQRGGPVARLVHEFTGQLRAITGTLEDLAGFGGRHPPVPGALPLPGSFSGAEMTAIADSIAAQRRSIAALQAQLSSFDEQLAVLE
jgi:hypothetical protein